MTSVPDNETVGGDLANASTLAGNSAPYLLQSMTKGTTVPEVAFRPFFFRCDWEQPWRLEHTSSPAREQSLWSSWNSRRVESLPPTIDVVTVETCSDDGDREQPTAHDAPEMEIDERTIGDDDVVLTEVRPGKGRSVGASP
jgi:hypothetical protein